VGVTVFAISVLYLLSKQAKEKTVTSAWSNERSKRIIRSFSRLRNRDGIASVWCSTNWFLDISSPYSCTCRLKYDSYVFGFSARKPVSLRSTISSRMMYYLFFAF